MVNYLKKGVKSYILIINNEGLLLLVNLINDNLIIPKIYFLYDLINWYNIKNYIYILNKKIIIIFLLYFGVIRVYLSWEIFFFENLDKK